jgi:ketosteroid isomerase-like protein
MKRFAGLAALALLMTGCMAPDNHDANVTAIKNTETQWNADWAAKDLDKIVAHYADDVFIVSPGAPALTTKDAARAAFKEVIADPTGSLKFQPTRVEVSAAGDIGYTMGEYQLTRQGVNDHGSYVTTYRHQPDGSWKAVADINTSAVPPAK